MKFYGITKSSSGKLIQFANFVNETNCLALLSVYRQAIEGQQYTFLGDGNLDD
jgi:hypothetical protein